MPGPLSFADYAIFQDSQPTRLPAWAEPGVRTRRPTVWNPAVNGEEWPSIQQALSATVDSVTLNLPLSERLRNWAMAISIAEYTKKLSAENQQ